MFYWVIPDSFGIVPRWVSLGAENPMSAHPSSNKERDGSRP